MSDEFIPGKYYRYKYSGGGGPMFWSDQIYQAVSSDQLMNAKGERQKIARLEAFEPVEIVSKKMSPETLTIWECTQCKRHCHLVFSKEVSPVEPVPTSECPIFVAKEAQWKARVS